jgi:hypothetical protein
VSARQYRRALVAATVAAPALVVSAWLAASHWKGETPRSAAIDNADAPHSAAAGAHPGVHSSQQAGDGPMITNNTSGVSPLRVPAHAVKHAAQPRQTKTQQQAGAAYRDPFRAVNGLIPERIDMGADFGGSGPVYALGDAVITNATGNSAGWPGGGWITYRLADGPASGLTVYVAEDLTPTVQAGQHVLSSTVIANMFSGGDGIETGWAMPDGASAESQQPAAGGISGSGPFPTMIGLNFEELLQSLGVPAGNNRTQHAYGLLPAGYPASWT